MDLSEIDDDQRMKLFNELNINNQKTEESFDGVERTTDRKEKETNKIIKQEEKGGKFKIKVRTSSKAEKKDYLRVEDEGL
jgi:hypothetical protein